ncbi:GmrSD restriction endonuclease domain-containing protein [Streptomyces pseudovenezuelae]|uniref:GmrSD restriction endonuclease domain-containing protein n=1 Tax=Streptomyces pseudovenezuelae TaxID=67350 RepID=UPI003712A71C
MPSIRQLIQAVSDGRVRIPAFQRGFVWDADRVAQLMDSIYKGYPFGALLFWRTRAELKTERDLGPFHLPPRPDDYPIDYVLDGQQRLTSIFGVFQTELTPSGRADWADIYFDYRVDADAQESLFVPLTAAEIDPDRYFPLNVFFDASKYGSAFRALPETVTPKIDELYSRFKEVDVPVQTFVTDDRAGVAIVFERVNRLGVELDTLQLLSAWTWSDDFDLQRRFGELSEELEPFGFKGVGEDITLLLRCCAAVVDGDASPKTLVSLNGTKVREQFNHVVNGIKGAIDFVRRELKVEKLDNLPHATLLVPLAVFFAAPESKSVKMSSEQRTTLLRWFWKACFSARYGRVVQRNLQVDVEEAIKLKRGDPSKLDDISAQVDDRFFLENNFNLNAVSSKTFVLLLAQERPLSFVSGSSVDLSSALQAYNRNEFHHLYPQAYLRSVGVPTEKQSPLANLCFINAIDNKVLGGDAPSDYRLRISQNDSVLQRALCPDEELFADNYDRFLKVRARLLVGAANALMSG